jgi:hypothetical protein
MWVYFQRKGWREALVASLISGFVGGFGFATATLLKLVEMKGGWQTNYHSILEQSYGLINGIGLAAAMLFLARSAPVETEDAPAPAWTRIYAVIFVWLAISYLNLAKNPEVWIKAKAMPAVMAGLSAGAWFDLGYLAMTAAVLGLLLLHRRQRISIISEHPLGRGQLLYLVLLWWMVVGNFERALVSFAPQRLVTEGVIFFNAVVCTCLVLAIKPANLLSKPGFLERYSSASAALIAGAILFAATTCGDWAIVRALYGNQFAGQAALHIRFGPDATATKKKPAANQPHP